MTQLTGSYELKLEIVYLMKIHSYEYIEGDFYCISL